VGLIGAPLFVSITGRPRRRQPPRGNPMQTIATTSATAMIPPRLPPAYAGYQIIRRNGAVVSFEPNKIAVALMKAFLAVHGTQGAASASVRETVDALTESVVRALLRSRPGGGTFHIEDVQDQVELGLMRGGHHEVARAYVLYRERRTQERARQVQVAGPARAGAARDRPRPAGAAGHGRAVGAGRIGLPGLGADVRPSPSWPRRAATCTTACRSTRSTRPPSWPRAP
jgi:ribonucleoside-diphosphate reductase alpha chain